MLKKLLRLSTILIIVALVFYSNVNAAEVKYSLNVSKKSAGTTSFNNSNSYFDNIITSIDSENGKADVELTISNSKKEDDEENKVYENTEIFIIVSESLNEENRTNISGYVKTLADKVFEANSKTKIGIVGMTGTKSSVDENNIPTEEDEGKVPGSIDNAEILSMPTRDSSQLVNAITNMNPEENKYHPNLQVAIRIAKNNFSDNVNKILISLFDNVPGIVIGEKSEINYGGWTGLTAEEAVKNHLQKVVNDTKKEILSLKDSNIDFILLRPENTSFDQRWYKVSTGELLLEFDGSPYVNQLYGTIENPTYGKMYSLTEDNLEQVVTENIYKDVIEETGTAITDISLKYQFSQDLLDNYDITFEENNIVDTQNLKSDGYITINIDKLDVNETEKVKYSLQLKNMKNEKLVDKEIPIISQADLTYVDYYNEENTITSKDSPSLKLSKEEIPDEPEQPTNDDGKDETVAPGKLPQTGMTPLLFTLIAIAVIGAIVFIKKTNDYKDIK